MEVLKRVDEQRSALLRSVSHDLRSPLATIRAVTTDLRDGVVYEEPTRVELLTTVCDEVERLDRIVANLLSLSRIEAGAFSPERQAVPLDELVAERVRRLKGLFRAVRLQVELPPDLPLVDGDYTQLELVLTNLLENAGRHAPPGSTVRIAARPKGELVEVRIADEGFGVPDWEREQDLRAVPPGRGQPVERRGAGHLQGGRRGPRRHHRRRAHARRRRHLRQRVARRGELVPQTAPSTAVRHQFGGVGPSHPNW